MNSGYWKEVWRENRRILLWLSVVAIVLVMLITVVMNVKKQGLSGSDDGNYGAGYLEPIGAEESEGDISLVLDDLHSVIKERYGDKLDGYEIAEGKLLRDGGWYVTTISKPLKDRWSLANDVFKVILHHDEQWEIVGEPSLYFEYAIYPDIPKEIIVSANNL